jgi:phospholipase/carboxylesterase
MMVRVRVMLVLFLLVFLAPGAGAGDDDFDIGTVAPSDLAGGNVDELLRKAQQSYLAGEFEPSARFYIRALRAKPGDPNALYNLACCYGLLTMPEQAARFVEAAWDAGFRDIGHIGSDPDFATVRETPAFTALMEKLRADAARREKEGGRRLPVECRVMGDVRVLSPDGMEQRRRYPLVVGLHGFGSNGESFARLFAARKIDAPFIYCVPQAPYAFSSGNDLAMSWGFGGESVPLSAEIRSGILAEEYVLAAVAAVKREYLVDERRVFVLGFSQGAGMAFRLGIRHPEVFTAAIPIGGWCEPGEYTAKEIRRARAGSRFLVCHSPEDRVVPYDSCAKAKAFLTEQGLAHQVLDYAGGHSVPANLLQRVVPFIDRPVLGEDGTVPPSKGAGTTANPGD